MDIFSCLNILIWYYSWTFFPEHKVVRSNKSDKLATNTGSSEHSNLPSPPILTPSERLTRRAVSDQDWPPFTSQTEAGSSKPEDCWTLVTSKGYQLRDSASHPNGKPFQSIDFFHVSKSRSFDSGQEIKHINKTDVSAQVFGMQESTSPGWSSLPGPSNEEDTIRIQSSKESSFDDSDNCRALRSDGNFKRSPVKESAFNSVVIVDNTANHQPSWPSGTTETEHFPSRKKIPFVTKNQKPFIDRYASSSSGLAASKLPASSVPQCLQPSATNRRGGFENTPISQWKSLEKISPLKMHQTLELSNPAESPTLATKTQSRPDSVMPDFSNSGNQTTQSTSHKPPREVVSLCNHFLQDRKTPLQPPYRCFNCSKRSKFVFGIWQSSKREWQVMRPYPKNINFETPFQICWRYRNNEKCRESCTFAHGEEELALWTTERQAGTNAFYFAFPG